MRYIIDRKGNKMTTKELETLKNLFHLYQNGVINEFQMGISLASHFTRNEISKESFQKVCDFFGATESNQVLEYVHHVDGLGREIKMGLPKETIDFINLFAEE